MEVAKTNEVSMASNEIRDSQMKLLNMICATLIHEPRYYSSADQGKTSITAMVNTVARNDPEFIFKLALYVRDDLNIRSTANYLLALAANNKNCHPFFKKYFTAIIRLPSDMLEVVTLYMALEERYLQGNSIPSVLRKAVTKKFPEFDVYQLAKYNKERSQKRKNKKSKENGNKMQVERPIAVRGGRGRGRGGRQQPQRVAAPVPTDANEKPIPLTLKQLIRKAHIAEPAEQVMSIVGKKYPETDKLFAKSGLKGQWDVNRAGKRMKLPTPETWETLLSAKGNKHTTWQELLDHKKLPIMAMLRNLRNMLITGISPEHHELVLNRLTDEKTIANSRQLPWRFLSAYEAININLEELMNSILDNDGSEEKNVVVNVRGKKGRQMGAQRVIKKKAIIPVHMPDMPLIQRYREAIDTAIRISTMNNIKPIAGRTVVFVDVSGSMRCPCSTRGNMGSIQQVFDIAILLGLMLQDVCEESEFRIFSSPGTNTKGRCDISVPLEPNSILNNIKRVTKYSEQLGGGTDFPYDYLIELIDKKEKIDNFIIISDMMIAPGKNEMHARGHTVGEVLKKYRGDVNPDLLFVALDLYGSGRSIVDVNTNDPKNVLITGFSDNILRFIAESGDKKQLEYVRTIDEVKKLNKPKGQRKEKTVAEKLEGKQEN
eukprot:TRINITY_DN29901_c0_g1_i1.p1 TRINITY_DN29901_c0_g1~~TRINITY_DN29901_c0_g1_i1.p1  ORF type:complete len:658 (+),score=296.62 TRINITY_DN29901_c0_g1_i1:99-2072(+)